MRLNTLFIEHFRNIAKAELSFDPKINIFLGENGQGKTNTLEAIFCLSLARPFRTREKEIFLEHKAEYGRVRGEVLVGKSEQEILEIFWENFDLKRNRTIYRKNGIEKNSTEFLESKHFFGVLFTPEEMEMPFSAPKRRRQHLSRVLSPLFPQYLIASIQYEKILRHRNRLLASYHTGRVKKMEFDFWDAELSKWSRILVRHRSEYVEFVTAQISQKYRLISAKKDVLQFHFLPSLEAGEDLFEVLQHNFRQDVQYRSTQKGPHRDDFELSLRGKPLSENASRGEIRSALIALKLCEREFIAQTTSIPPVLLLDDVFSELDEHRRMALLQIFANDQVFISTTHVPKIPKKQIGVIFNVKNGEIA